MRDIENSFQLVTILAFNLLLSRYFIAGTTANRTRKRCINLLIFPSNFPNKFQFEKQKSFDLQHELDATKRQLNDLRVEYDRVNQLKLLIPRLLFLSEQSQRTFDEQQERSEQQIRVRIESSKQFSKYQICRTIKINSLNWIAYVKTIESIGSPSFHSFRNGIIPMMNYKI